MVLLLPECTFLGLRTAAAAHAKRLLALQLKRKGPAVRQGREPDQERDLLPGDLWFAGNTCSPLLWHPEFAQGQPTCSTSPGTYRGLRGSG